MVETIKATADEVFKAAESIGPEALRRVNNDCAKAQDDGLGLDEWAEALSTYTSDATLTTSITNYLQDECYYEGEPVAEPASERATTATVPQERPSHARTARQAAAKLSNLKAAQRTFARLAGEVADHVGVLKVVKGASTHANQLIRMADTVAASTTKVHRAQQGLERAADKFDKSGGNGEALAVKADKGTTTFILDYDDREYSMSAADGRAIWSLLSGAPADQNVDATITGRLLRRLPADINGRVIVTKVRESDGAEYKKQFQVYRGDTSVVVRVENPTKEDADKQMLSASEFTLHI